MFQKYPNHHPHRTNKLIHLLNIYNGKTHIKMKPIMISIKNRLLNNHPISKRQLEVLIPYLKNDLKHPNKQIYDLFSVCIYDIPSVSDEEYLSTYYPQIYKEYEEQTSTESTLEPHFV